MIELLDTADKLASIGAFIVALILFVRGLRKGNEAQKRTENDRFYYLQGDPNPPQQFREPITRAEAFEQHRNFKEGMYLPAPLFIEAYQYKRKNCSTSRHSRNNNLRLFCVDFARSFMAAVLDLAPYVHRWWSMADAKSGGPDE